MLLPSRAKRAILNHPTYLFFAAVTVTVVVVSAIIKVTSTNHDTNDSEENQRKASHSNNQESQSSDPDSTSADEEARRALATVPRPSAFSRLFPGRRTRKRPMTISAKKIILWNPSPDPATPNYAFVEGTLTLLTNLSTTYEIYLLVVVSSEQETDHISRLLNQSGLYASSVLDKRCVLYCETEQGKSHIVRHIEPIVHVESDLSVVENVAQFVRHVVYVATSGPSKGVEEVRLQNVETCTCISNSSLNSSISNK